MKFYKIDDQVIISDKALSVGTELIANTVDAAQEKHVPVITQLGNVVSKSWLRILIFHNQMER